MLKKKRKTIFFLVVLILLIVPLTSADFLGWIKKTITGKASSMPTNVSVSVTGANQAVVQQVILDSTYNPIESNKKTITAYIIVYDADGVNDINDSSAEIYFNKTGETTRQNTSCLNLADIDANTANFSCSVDMWYWDGDGTWSVNASANDLGNLTRAYNTSVTFSYAQLKAMIISPTALTWPSVSPGDANQTSDNDPTIINNTGNYDGTISITALDLLGETTPTEMIHAENFTADIDTGGTAECDGTALSNNSAVTITGTNANRGNLSAGGGAGQEQIYYCIPELPSTLSSQVYSTEASGSWTIAY